jgi:hypothetical protein
MAFKDGLAVYDFTDSHAGAVSICNGPEKLILYPGQVAIVSPTDNVDFANVNPAQLVAYRNIKTRCFGRSGRAFTGEFSTIQAIRCVMPLKQIISSGSHQSQMIVNRMLKTSGILIQLTQGAGKFEQVPRIRVVNESAS